MNLIEISKVHEITVIKLNRPEKLNAINRDMWLKLREVVAEECSSNSKGLIITGSGRAFSAGDDIGSMYDLRSLDESLEFFNIILDTLRSIALCPKPVVAAVNGLAVGGGAELLLLVDYVVASKDSWLSFPEARLGLIPPILLTVGVDTLGLRTTRRLSMRCDRVTVEEALKLGLVDEIVEGDRLLEVAARRAMELYEAVPEGTRGVVKKILYERYSKLVEEAIRILSELAITGEAKDRMRAFLDKKLKA